MARRGPVPLYTDELAMEVLHGLAVGMKAADAHAAAGVSDDTVERWRRGKSGAPAEFAERYKAARLRAVRGRLRRLVQLAEEGDVRAIESWLDRCAPDYRKTTNHEISGPGGGPIQHETTVTIRDLATRAAEDEGLDADLVVAEAERWLAETRA
ncbi:MAG: hypothetical protein M3R02_08795 [Chloroflexota bacterium]|nr:hypothetical protein [Chloroflexota bacterium]